VTRTQRAVAGRIRAELEELACVVKRTVSIWRQATTASDDYHVDAVALNLHGFYAGIERVFEVIADGIDETRPAGPHWHEETSRQLSAEITGVRPAVLSPETRDRLDRYRDFRHVVRNVYTYNLDAEQIDVLIKQLPDTMSRVSEELQAFAGFLEQCSN